MASAADFRTINSIVRNGIRENADCGICPTASVIALFSNDGGERRMTVVLVAVVIHPMSNQPNNETENHLPEEKRDHHLIGKVPLRLKLHRVHVVGVQRPAGPYELPSGRRSPCRTPAPSHPRVSFPSPPGCVARRPSQHDLALNPQINRREVAH